MTIKAIIVAAMLPAAVIASPVPSVLAADNTVEASDKCYARETTNTGKRHSCEISVSIKAPEGYAIDPATLTVDESAHGAGVGCSEPEIVYDGSRAVGAKVTGKALSDIVPKKGRAKVECTLSAEIQAA